MKCDKLKAEHMIINEDYTALYYPKESVDAAITELKQKLESVQASMYCDVVDAGMDNRRLKRALWLSRAATARNMRTYEALDNYTQNHPSRKSRWNYISSQRYDCWFYAWDNVEQKCLKKAEEYK